MPLKWFSDVRYFYEQSSPRKCPLLPILKKQRHSVRRHRDPLDVARSALEHSFCRARAGGAEPKNCG